MDPVGPSKSYKEKLSRYFPGIEITVEPHADALYASVSAASICAKVTRDQVLQYWIWLEPELEDKLSKAFGSGYPSGKKKGRKQKREWKTKEKEEESEGEKVLPW